MLVRVEDRQVETFPIAGTRPHLEDRRENAKLTKELLADPKERAEHTMLVDLARNDVGRVAKYGSVKVPELFTVQQFSHVQHIVSRVVGDPPPRVRLLRRHARHLPRRHGLGRAQAPGDGDNRGARAGEARPLRWGAGLLLLQRQRGLCDNHQDARRQGPAAAASRPGRASSPTPTRRREWHETESKAAGLMKAVEKATGRRLIGEGRR